MAIVWRPNYFFSTKLMKVIYVYTHHTHIQKPSDFKRGVLRLAFAAARGRRPFGGRSTFFLETKVI